MDQQVNLLTGIVAILIVICGYLLIVTHVTWYLIKSMTNFQIEESMRFQKALEELLQDIRQKATSQDQES